jgi:hypothetical protein
MDPLLSRRRLLACAGTYLTAAAQPFPVRDGVPRVDYHAHPSPAISPARAIEIAAERGVKFGLVQHAGNRRQNEYWGLLSNDDQLNAWVRSLEGKPVFKGVQAELTNWSACFSRQALHRLDYVLTDALTMPAPGGRLVHIWTSEFECNNPQKWMDRYVDYHVEIMATQPIDIIANPTYLPDALAPDHDRLWTERRMRALVDAAVKHHVAIEINSRFRVPRLPFLQMAKAAGAKFSFGSNLHTPDQIGNIDYCVDMYRRLNLTMAQFWTPKSARRAT